MIKGLFLLLLAMICLLNSVQSKMSSDMAAEIRLEQEMAQEAEEWAMLEASVDAETMNRIMSEVEDTLRQDIAEAAGVSTQMLSEIEAQVDSLSEAELEKAMTENIFGWWGNEKRYSSLDVGAYFIKGRIKVQVEASTKVPNKNFDVQISFGRRQVLFANTLRTRPEKNPNPLHQDNDLGDFEFSYFGPGVNDDLGIQVEIRSRKWFGIRNKEDLIFDGSIEKPLMKAIEEVEECVTVEQKWAYLNLVNKPSCYVLADQPNLSREQREDMCYQIGPCHWDDDLDDCITSPPLPNCERTFTIYDDRYNTFDRDSVLGNVKLIVTYRNIERLDYEMLHDGTNLSPRLWQEPPHFDNEFFKTRFNAYRRDERQEEAQFRGIVSSMADKYHFLVVPGFCSKLVMAYFSDAIELLSDLGFSVTKSTVDTIRTSAVEMETIRQDIITQAKRTGKRVIVLGHSKGAMDSISILGQTDRDILHELDGDDEIDNFSPYVRAVIGLQGPLFGGAVDELYRPGLVKKLAMWAIKIFGDNVSLYDLSFKSRRKLWNKYEFDPSALWSKLGQDTKLLTVGTWRAFEKEKPFIDIFGKQAFGVIANVVMKTTGFRSDGLAHPETTFMPRDWRNRAVILEGPDHMEAILDLDSLRDYHPKELTWASIITLFQYLEDDLDDVENGAKNPECHDKIRNNDPPYCHYEVTNAMRRAYDSSIEEVARLMDEVNGRLDEKRAIEAMKPKKKESTFSKIKNKIKSF